VNALPSTTAKFRPGRALLESVFTVALAFVLFFAALFIGTPWTRQNAFEIGFAAIVLAVPLVLIVWRGRYNQHKWEISGKAPSFKVAFFVGSMFILSAAVQAVDAIQNWERPVLNTNPVGVTAILLQVACALFSFRQAWKIKKEIT
jgi:hypothetical protein